MSEVSGITEVEQFEAQLDDAKYLSERAEMAERLAKNKDFKKLILEGFCLKDAARYAQESGDPLLEAPERADALNMAQASGHLKRFLSLQIQMGRSAQRSIPEIEAALAEVRSEEGAR